MIVENFIGPSNTLAAITASADRTINMYEELVDPGVAKGKTWLAPAPGLAVFSTLGGTGMSVELFYQNARVFAVAGEAFFEIFSDGSNTNYGAVASVSGITPTMCSNGTAGHQVFITSGLNGYIFDINTNVLTLIADTDFPQGSALEGEFMDGYFLVLINESRAFQISALEDGTDWDGLDIAERSEASDNLIAMRRSHREIWFMGNQTGEVWYDNGDPDFPFAPIQGVFIEQGGKTSTLQRIANSVIWVSLDQDGSRVVNIADGYTPRRVSTFAIEFMLQSATAATSMKGWTYQERGHWFYNLHIEGRDDTTPVFDLTMGRWAERGLWDEENQQWHPNRPISHCYSSSFIKHLVGDRSTGTVYHQSVDIFTQELA